MSTANGKASVTALLALINRSANEAIGEYELHGAPVPTLESTVPHPLDQIQDVLKLRKIIRVLEGACDQLCATLAPPAASIVNRAQSFEPVALQVAVQTKVADVLNGYPEGLHIKKIGDSVGIDPGKLSRIMRLLATRHIFLEVNSDVFANNRLSTMLLSTNTTSSLVFTITANSPRAIPVLYRTLTDPETRSSYEPGSSAFMQLVKSEGVEGSYYDWLQANPFEMKEFTRAMNGLGSMMGSLNVVHHFPWRNFSTVCDVGSGQGSFSLPLRRLYPTIKLTLLDRPEIIAEAKYHWQNNLPLALSDGNVDFVSANFFESVPVKNQDIYYLRNIVHNWPDADAAKILRNIREVMGPQSRVLLHEYVLQHLNPSATLVTGRERAPEPLLPNYGEGEIRAHYQDLRMLLVFNAKERTFDEFLDLGKSVGLKFERIWDMADTSLLEFSKGR